MIQILELFGGIGSPRCALRNIGIPVKAIDYVEIDEKAVRSYNAMFADELPYKTQSVVGWNLKPDILIHGSPCQDFSIAGHQGKAKAEDGRINRGKGADKGSGTRSSLMWETIHIIEQMGEWKPQYVIWENVKNVLSKYMRVNFNRYLAEMERLGYSNNFEILADVTLLHHIHTGKERAGSMTKKKPDFLRDLDTAIMDELTGGGIKENAAGLVGTLTQIKEIKQLCGLPFCGYMAKLETVRPSGVPDEVTVVFAEDVPYRACNGIEFDVMQEFVEGSRLLLTGKAQTLKDFQSGRLLVYILADFVAVSEKAVEQDEVAVRGIIANKPTHRETPRGKRITDITVKVRNELTGGSCYLPCICWQEQADEVEQWQQGDTVELLGRYQSRQYEKVLDTDTGEREQRTAYEVSVRLIRRKEEAENEC